MTTSTRPHDIPSPQPRPPWRTAAAWMLRTQSYLAVWFWAVAVVTITGILAVVGRFTDVQMSAVQYAYHGGLWFPFGISIVLVAGFLTVHVALGMTRRSFVRGALVVAVATGLLYAAVLILLLVLERGIYDRLGWVPGVSDGSSAEVLDGGVWTTLWGTAAMFVAGTISGLLVGAAYYRWGGWWGTLLLPLTLAPILLTSVLGLDRHTQLTPWDLTWEVLGPARPLLVLLVPVLGGLAFHLLTRRIPIAAKES